MRGDYMKLFTKIKISLLATLLMIGITTPYIFAAGSSVVQSPPIIHHDVTNRFGSLGPDPKYTVLVTLTADSGTNAFPAFVINGTCTTATGTCTSINTLDGWYLFKVETWAGAKAQPTNAWSFTAKDGNGTGYDLCAGKGTSTQSNGTVPIVTDCYPTSQNYMPVAGPITVAATGNSVASAIVYMLFYFLPR